ncbi:trypsin-like peptidase domain-containing protein [Agrococcus citreus]|uniref:Trypsin-like peptidase domain-containing protein n=2 Tax=Agrococcus citreus TaxID=84643 RepID=A0ABN1YL77_9MICO
MDCDGTIEPMTNPYDRVPNPAGPQQPADDRWRGRQQPEQPQSSSSPASSVPQPPTYRPSAAYQLGPSQPGGSEPIGSLPSGYQPNASATRPYAFGEQRPGAAQPTFGYPQSGQQQSVAREPRSRRRAGLAVTSIVAAALLGGAAGFGGGALAVSQQQPQTQAAAQSGTSAQPVSDPQTVADVAAAAGPSVVTVQATSSSGSGEGSGVAVAAGGYIVTNNHVVTLDGQSADAAITVETSDGRLLAAEIVGTDPVVDLAVIRVDAELPVITFAASDDVRVGDTAIAIGAPLGLSNSVTDGIVSAVDRGLRIASSAAPSEEDESQQQPFGFWQPDGTQAAQQDISIPVVQTDASINPGNSGGALLNASGQLVGVNVAIASMGQGDSAGSIGIGFAIESSLVQRVVDEIIAEGSASHGLLGASVSDVTDASVGTVGALIREVVDGGAAAAAGLREGDVITSIEGQPVTGATDATAQVRAHAAGTAVTVTYLRDGQEAEAEVTLGELT